MQFVSFSQKQTEKKNLQLVLCFMEIQKQFFGNFKKLQNNVL